ncbi:MAG: ribonuclease P protein component [Deltaproteobacteria bacterium]|nr:ribonuclease P protein component [Deltaproteobacteria bacterium]
MLKKSEFSLCYHKGKRYFSANFVFFVLESGLETWRLGLSVSRKIGGATRRNRVKRLLREFFRLNQAHLPSGLDMVAVPKKGLDPLRLSYGLVEQELFPLLTGLFKHYGQKRDRPALPDRTT